MRIWNRGSILPTYNVIMERITRTCLAIVMNTHAKLLISSPLMGTTSPPADIVTGEHLAGAHKQIELEISPGPLISKDLEHVWHSTPLTKSPRVSIPRFWGAGGKAGEGRYGPEASQAPRWSIFNRV